MKTCRCGIESIQYSTMDKECPSCRSQKAVDKRKANMSTKGRVKKKKPKSALQKRKDNPRSGYWKKKADALWGAVIHEIYKSCPVDDECSGHIEAHHLISRANVATRHKVENGIGLCSKHHKFCKKLSAHGAPLAFSEWLIEEMPEKWNWCSKNKHKIAKPDYQEAYKDLEAWCIENAPHLLD